MLRQLFEEELARQKAEYGENDAHTAQAARDLGLWLARQGDQRGAREAFAQAVGADEKVLGPTADQTLADVAELAAVSESRPAEALWQSASRSSDAEVAARSLAGLGGLREQAGDRAGAARFYRQALAKEESASGKDSARVAARLNTLSLFVAPAEGVVLLDRALRIATARLGARHLGTASIQVNLAGLLSKTGHAQRAARLAKEATSVFEEALGPEHPRTAAGLLIQANARRASGDDSDVEPMLRRALAIREQALGPRHPQTLVYARALADFLREIGKEQQAAELDRRINEKP